MEYEYSTHAVSLSVHLYCGMVFIIDVYSILYCSIVEKSNLGLELKIGISYKYIYWWINRLAVLKGRFPPHHHCPSGKTWLPKKAISSDWTAVTLTGCVRSVET